ncbi:pectinesterase family protein [Plectosphaerella plurivora]|uniref:pectinesterase n=1 Tax=Plectosphaerella plurivora TaxID=936078 RepID=A0A9P9A3B0_9PEZI|nr:pectinesterase family protein [Plectosphaerella plurivora]
MKTYSALACFVSLVLPRIAAGAPLDARAANGASHGPATTYAECQKKTCPPRAGCPDGTIYVSQDDKHADFKSIQAAILSVADHDEPATILIAPGQYTEQLNVTRRGPLTLLGVSERPHGGELYADITASSEGPENEVQVWWNAANYNVRFPDNAYTSVLTVGPNLNATLTGAGPTGFAVPADTPFGCTDFRAYNIDFRNEEFPRANGPGHAVGVSRANAGFYSCGLYGFQDTLYVGKLGNAYFYDNVIAGQTDFLYGFGTAYIDRSSLSLRNCGGGITAWKGTNTTFENKYGVYISDSQVLAANTSIATTIKGKCPLGRPWNAQHRSIFIESYFDESVRPDGYIQWGTTDPRITNLTFMAVYNDRGPGWNPDALKANNLTRFLDDSQVKPYLRPVDVFIDENGTPGDVEWIDHSVLAE